MSLILIHGEQTHLSRQKLVELIKLAKAQDQEVVTLAAKNLTPADLETALGGASLFGNHRLVVIEELHSLPVSARRKSLIELVKNAETDLILWEKRVVTKTQGNALKPAQVFEFKLSSAVFKWLDSLSADKTAKTRQLGLLKAAVTSDGADLCSILLARQVRLLIQAKTNAPMSGAPFMISKWKNQASSFSLEQLLKLHHSLLELDLQQKTSRQPWSLANELDLLLIRL